MQVLISFQETDKTPVGIGNLVARLIFESCINDGMNLNGAWDISGNLRSANLLPFKGGLILESFFRLTQIIQKRCQITILRR